MKISIKFQLTFN